MKNHVRKKKIFIEALEQRIMLDGAGASTFLDLIGKLEEFPEKELFGCSGFKGINGFAFRNNDNNIQWIENEFVYSENLGFDFDEYYSMKDFKIISSDSLKKVMKKKCRAYAQMAFEIIK